jgi:hypothetical protein
MIFRPRDDRMNQGTLLTHSGSRHPTPALAKLGFASASINVLLLGVGLFCCVAAGAGVEVIREGKRWQKMDG